MCPHTTTMCVFTPVPTVSSCFSIFFCPSVESVGVLSGFQPTNRLGGRMVDDPTSFPPVEPHTYTKKNSLLSDDEIDMVVTLRMNRDFMAEYHVRVRKKSCKQANRLILWGRGTDIFFLNFFVFCFSITFFLSFFSLERPPLLREWYAWNLLGHGCVTRSSWQGHSSVVPWHTQSTRVSSPDTHSRPADMGA